MHRNVKLTCPSRPAREVCHTNLRCAPDFRCSDRRPWQERGVLQNPVAFLRLIALIEAVSTLILFGIAMPLKYVWGLPIAVRIAGSIHGGLFLVFCYALLRVLQQTDWPLRRAALVFVASVVPVAPFLLDGRMTAWAAAFRRA